MVSPLIAKERRPVGQAWLRQELGLEVPPPAVESYLVAGARRTEVDGSRIIELYPRQYAPGESSVSHLRFMLRHEPADLGVLAASLEAIDPGELETWVRAEPTGAYSRRIWFFYETFTGRTLNLEDVRSGSYVDALDAARHVTGERRRSPRHRVADNLLGGPGLCPSVRRTPRLVECMRSRMDEEAHALVRRYDPLVLARAIGYLYTKETRSSFAIEGETPTAGRTERFISALKAASAFDPTDKAALVRLQRTIVDLRYGAVDWRDFQSFVGMTVGDYREQVDFICPRPGDVPELMRSWMVLTRRMLESEVHPVVAAAVCAFSFVFIHPFEDGNGRIHRFLMHSILAKRGYTPPGVIFPLSAAILRDQRSYDEALESFSRPLFDFIDWRWTPERKIVVRNDTDRLYRYFDATAFAEYLFDRVADTVRHDLDEELSFIAVFDRAFQTVREIVDMPDRRASLLVRLCIQNGGRLSARKRKQFRELHAEEIAAMEAAIQDAMESAEHRGSSDTKVAVRDDPTLS